MEFKFTYIFVVIWFLLNFTVSVYIARRNDLDEFQKKGQIFLVWIIPVIGAAFLWLYNRSMDVKIKRGKEPFGGGDNGPYHD